MKGTMLYGSYEVRFEERPDPTIVEPTDTIIRVAAACGRGSEIWPCRGIEPIDGPTIQGWRPSGDRVLGERNPRCPEDAFLARAQARP